MKFFAGIWWLAPYNGIFLPIIFLVIALAWYRYRCKQRVVRSLTSAKWRRVLLSGFSPLKEWGKIFFTFLAILFLIIAVMRPAWGKKEEMVAQEGRDLLIALDISGSMLATDVNPNRLEAAKTKIKKMAQSLRGDRVGLILFSGSAFVLCPLTKDHAAFDLLLDTVDAQAIASGGTDIAQAMQMAIRLFSEQQTRKNKLLLIVTDGEDFSPNLAQINEEARSIGLQIFTIGVGTVQGAPVPLFDHHGVQIGHQKDESGAVVISRLNESVLHSISDAVSGYYQPLTHDDEDIKRLTQMVQSFERERSEDAKVTWWHEQYHWFILVAWISLLIEWLL